MQTKTRQVIEFKVKLSWNRRTYRTVALRDDMTLDDLAKAIHEVFGLDWDAHLHAFYFGNRWKRGSELTQYSDPRLEDDFCESTDKIVLSSLNLETKQKFEFMYDFGACLDFEIEITKSYPEEKSDAYSRLIASKGEWDYDDYDELA